MKKNAQNLVDECSVAINEMVTNDFLSFDQAELLRTTNKRDPEFSHWFVATIHHHALAINNPLTDQDFARLCLMSIHRYKAEQSLLPNAEDNPRITELFSTFSALGVPDNRSDGYGVLRALRNYLTRTVEEVGTRVVADLEATVNSDWGKLKEPSAYFNIRSAAEMAYIKGLEERETHILGPIQEHIQSGQSLAELLPK